MASPGILVTILAFALVIGPLVFFHEMGHYLVGRWFGVKAEAFSIGFGREIIGLTDKRGTRWKFGWLPLGGYVRFAGDMNPASQPDAAWLALPAAERNRTFQAKPVWQRALIVLAGPAVNILLAIMILAGFAAAYGELVAPPVVNGVLAGSAAAKAGLRTGDRITALGGRRVDDFSDMVDYVRLRPNETIDADFVRAGRAMTTPLTIAATIERDRFGNAHQMGQLGILGGRPVLVRIAWWRAPGVAVARIGGIVRTTIDALGQVVTGRRSAKDLNGPVGVARIAGEQFELGAAAFVYLIAFVSINLGFINLLPIPMMDGGHLLFYGVEAVRRRPIEPIVLEWAFRGGFAALLALMIFVTINDLAGFGLWKGLAGLIG